MKDYRKEIKKLSEESILSKKYRNKKLLLYFIRTLIAIIIIYFLWDFDWIKWVLYIYVPLNLISLVSIFGWNLFLNKKMKQSQDKFDSLKNSFEEE